MLRDMDLETGDEQKPKKAGAERRRRRGEPDREQRRRRVGEEGRREGGRGRQTEMGREAQSVRRRRLEEDGEMQRVRRRQVERGYRDYDYEEDPYEAKDPMNKKGTTVILWLLLLVLIAVFVFAVYQLASILLEYRAGEEEYNDVRTQVESLLSEVEVEEEEIEETDEEGLPNHARNELWFDQLEFLYPGIVAWITIEDTVIDYPVMYSGDNSYYLTHTCRGTENSAGSIFLEQNNSTDLSDYHTLFYGHNMNNGSMFAALINYKSYDYWQEHRYITVETREGTLTYEIFACQVTTGSSDAYLIGFEAGDTLLEFVEYLQSCSLYDTGVEVTGEDHILTLSTCTNSGTGRLLVHAKLVDTPVEEE